MTNIKKTLAKVIKFEADTKKAKKSNIIKVSDVPLVDTIIIKSFSL